MKPEHDHRRETPETPGLRDLVARVWGRVQRRVGALVAFSVAFKIVDLLILAPATAGLLRLFLQRWGRYSVGNFEIVSFALSPVGLAGLSTVGILYLATLYLELSGLMLLIVRLDLAWWAAFPALGLRLRRLIELGARQFLAFGVVSAPFLAGVWLTHRSLWAGRDINGLLILRPPVFWLGAAIAGGLVLMATVLVVGLLLRWLFAVPAVLFEPEVSASRALAWSAERTAGRRLGLARVVLIGIVAHAAVSAAVLAVLKIVADALLDRIGLRLAVALPVTAVILIVQSVIVTALSIVGNVGFAGLVLGLDHRVVPEAATESEPRLSGSPPLRWKVLGLVLVPGVLTAWICLGLIGGLELDDRLEITGHRGAAAVAPENTVAAIRKAIEARAEWVEIDVQLTADGALVVTHDTDLSRSGGGPRAVGGVRLAEIQALDVGRLFGPEFAGERIPTLEEVMAAAGDQIRLTIELKPHGERNVPALVDAVLAAVRRAGFTDRARLCSQSYEAMKLARSKEPRLAVGFIAGAAVGDLSRLDVQFLMVNAPLATRRLVDRAALRGVQIHAWTINDPDRLAPLLDRGVGNIITDDPARMRARLEEIRALGPGERLLLRARNLLAD